MEAKDTVMTLLQIHTKDPDKSFLEAQAEISFRAGYEEGRLYGKQESLLNQAIINQQVKDAKQEGIREVVEFVEGNIPKTLSNYVGFWKNWQSKLNDWNL